MSEGDEADEGKRDDVRDEALTFLWVMISEFIFSFNDLKSAMIFTRQINVIISCFRNTLDSMMTKLLNNKISNTTEGEEERKCEKEKLEVISNSK